MRRSLLRAAFALTLAGCVGNGSDAPSAPVDATTAAIVNGERTTGNEPAVVAVLNRFGGLCTGTLVAPRIVLTAKHCVQNPNAAAPNDASAFVVGIGDQIRGFSETFNVTDVVTTPGTYTDSGGLGGALVGVDVAVVTLGRAADITPYEVFRGSPEDLFGETLRAVGFGEIPSGGAGVKYETTSTISSVRGGVIYTPPTICQGDSGGPLMTMDNEVIGVASFGTGSCGSGINGYNRVDRFLDMIDGAIRESGVCVGDGTEVCDGEDNDCDDAVDEDCAQPGEGCVEDADCVTLDCRDIDGESICAQTCDPTAPLTGCPPRLYCRSMGGCEGVCVPGSAGELPIDADCAADTECASLFCADPGDGRRRCLDPCEGDTGTCLDGEVCAAAAGACGGCVPADLVVGSRGLGEVCASDEECASGRCFEERGDAYCTRGCEDDTGCADGFHCRDLTETDAICVRGDRGGVGSGCVANADCDTDLFCATRGDVSWCSSFCDSGEDCPPDFQCVDVGGAAICVPDRGTIGSPCATGEECISGVCESVGPAGELMCTRLCSGDNLCEPGFVCERTADGVSAVCVPSVEPASGGGGGCSAAGGGDAPLFGFSLLGLVLFLQRRKAL
ncbi:MAG TPA: S1 family peptidase [Polyangiaceae bacterium LLY-WYZ-15_(1-7)]|nr:S1 family peptidase [Polyangiaceae bacterium LLY-WYZ-15_(1-7)]HJL05348.1 S1 family peptidase [Polyangiaceae bacterium LLY-WYZ-15_(1-7)]HJL07053.1 S1 family peptidase [Polyangiaceae bacterium LLY-WYZ-15_(1-7)]HJL21691.1 S1 family peptidase [Polyangiaceae bacterium LLY-WYZ-15_(1-7)]HJL33090.1 S1 family peptidase [Polyangiaceae bacterium LLY-WYZ-15_(1-7)]